MKGVAGVVVPVFLIHQWISFSRLPEPLLTSRYSTCVISTRAAAPSAGGIVSDSIASTLNARTRWAAALFHETWWVSPGSMAVM